MLSDSARGGECRALELRGHARGDVTRIERRLSAATSPVDYAAGVAPDGRQQENDRCSRHQHVRDDKL